MSPSALAHYSLDMVASIPHTIALTSPEPLGVSLWLVDLDADPSAWDATLLDQAERDRAARFRFEAHAQRHVASHVALRLILGQVTGMVPGTLWFTRGQHGKPRLAQPNAPHFNMSHSGGWALVGVAADQPIGVDIELPTDTADIEQLVQHHFSRAEQAAFQSTQAKLQAEAFLRCWTRKEACLKALGSGLSVEPGAFEAGLQATLVATAVPTQTDWCHMQVASLVLPIQAQAAIATVSPGSHHLAM